MIGRLGDDPIGDLIERQLLAERVRCLVRRDPAPTALMLRERRTGTAARVSYYRHGSAGSHLRPADLPDGIIEEAGVLHVSGITPALGPEPAATVREAMRRAREAAVPVSVDLNFRSRAVGRGDGRAGVPRARGGRGHPLRGRRRGAHRPRSDAAVARSARRGARRPRAVRGRGQAGAAGREARVDGRIGVPRGQCTRSTRWERATRSSRATSRRGCWAAGPRRLSTAAVTGAFAVTVPGDWEAFPRPHELTLLTAEEDVQR